MRTSARTCARRTLVLQVKSASSKFCQSQTVAVCSAVCSLRECCEPSRVLAACEGINPESLHHRVLLPTRVRV